MIKVGIVGCGKIAEQHLKFLSKRQDTQIVGLVDVQLENAKVLGEKYGINNYFLSLIDMIDYEVLDVVHICSPPEYHYEQTLEAIERGVHVLVEKPVALKVDQVDELYKKAKEKNVSICPNFLQLFHPRMLEVKNIIEQGQFGNVLRVESYYSMDAYTSDVYEAVGLPWSYMMPGGIFHNHITHPLYLTMFWIGDLKNVKVYPKTFGVLPQNMTDHIEVYLDGEHADAIITVSMVTKPPLYYVRVFFERGMVMIDFNRMNILVENYGKVPGAVQRFLGNYGKAWQLIRNTTANLFNILRGKMISYHGLEYLIDEYYGTLLSDNQPPISEELVRSVADTEEAILTQAGKLHPDVSIRPSRQRNLTQQERILVTGASGNLGFQVVQSLVESGYYVRATARPLSRIKNLEKLGVEIFFGDIRDELYLMNAMDGIDIVIHTAAGMRGPRESLIKTSVTGTDNISRAAHDQGVDSVIYISSMGIYDYFALKNGEEITENSQLENCPDERGAYTLAKRRAEDIALAQIACSNVHWTIIRPSIIISDYQDVFAPLTGIRLGNLLIYLGKKSNTLRLIHVEDVCDVILRIIQQGHPRYRIFNLSHPDSISVGEYIAEISKPGLPRIRVLYLPQLFLWIGSRILELQFKLRNKGPRLSPRKLAYWYGNNSVDVTLVRGDMKWTPKSSLKEQIRKHK